MHYIGATVSLGLIWDLGDVFLGVVILPNLLALLILSPKIVELTKSYFDRRPWEENARVHEEIVARRKGE
jgi:AGCS family alanine or glycine:cation symporter